MKKGGVLSGTVGGKGSQAALEQRLGGKLVTIDIAGHLFYVDIPMGMLRPKDDFLAAGIKFHEIDQYLNNEGRVYRIPYNVKYHSFQEINDEAIAEIPNGILIIEFPHERFLDPVGYNRKYGRALEDHLREVGIQSHFIAKILDGKDTRMHEVLVHDSRKQAAKIEQKNI